MSLRQGRIGVWVLKSWMFLCRIHVWVLIYSKNVFRYNIPYLLDKPGTGHQVILSIGLLYHDMLRCCYHLQSINDMFTMINVQTYNSMTTNTITILQVKGEVYLVDEPMLSQLDILEDHPTYYRSPQFSFDLWCYSKHSKQIMINMHKAQSQLDILEDHPTYYRSPQLL